jgi:hypothetical protein
MEKESGYNSWKKHNLTNSSMNYERMKIWGCWVKEKIKMQGLLVMILR